MTGSELSDSVSSPSKSGLPEMIPEEERSEVSSENEKNNDINEMNQITFDSGSKQEIGEGLLDNSGSKQVSL